MQSAVSNNNQTFIAKLGGDGGKQHLTQGLRGGGQVGFGLREALLKLKCGFAAFDSAAGGEQFVNLYRAGARPAKLRFWFLPRLTRRFIVTHGNSEVLLEDPPLERSRSGGVNFSLARVLSRRIVHR